MYSVGTVIVVFLTRSPTKYIDVITLKVQNLQHMSLSGYFTAIVEFSSECLLKA